MDAGASGSDWRSLESTYEDEVIGDDTLSWMFEKSVDRNRGSTAQLYQGGIYDRSLADPVIDEPPAGEYGGISYEKMRHVVRRLATGFRDLGVTVDDRIGIHASTRMEWALSDFAILAAGGVVTTVYTESSPDQVHYLLDDPSASGVVVENEELLDRVLSVEDDLDLSFIVVIDEFDRDRFEADRDDLYTLADVYERGDDNFDEETYRGWLDERDPDDLASLIYTSGTTGKPKGTKLTHWNFRVNVNQVYKRLGPRPDKDPDEPTVSPGTTSISFLPLAHVFERLAGHFVLFGAGATVGYVENPDTLADDIQRIQPEMGASVPRVYERIFDSMREQAGGSPVKERIFEWSLGVARTWARTDEPGLGLRVRHSVADRLVYSTVRENLGGEIEFMVSGGGSLSKHLCEIFLGMDLTILEGYGLTETAPVISTNLPGDIRPGTMGVPVNDMEVRIDDSVVDPTQFADVDGEVGELLVRGPNVTDGYWNLPGETDRAFSNGDWFRTGDVVERTDDEFLIYHDRIKEILVLSTGKNIAPQPIEDEFATDDRVDQIMVVGDDQKFVGAIVVPNFESLRRFADEEGIDLPAGEDALCADDRVRAWVQEAVDDTNENLERIERIKEFVLVSREWTAENDLLTPSMKKKRRNIQSAFEDALSNIYDETGTFDE